MDMPEGCDYDLTLYDEYGTCGRKGDCGDGKDVKHWPSRTGIQIINKYCIKIENKMGEEARYDYYKISFKVMENKEQEKTMPGGVHIRNLHGIQPERWKLEGIDKYNEVLMDTEKNYTKEWRNSPEVVWKSAGRKEIQRQRAQWMNCCAGEWQLSIPWMVEMEYVKIFANLKDFEKHSRRRNWNMIFPYLQRIWKQRYSRWAGGESQIKKKEQERAVSKDKKSGNRIETRGKVQWPDVSVLQEKFKFNEKNCPIPTSMPRMCRKSGVTKRGYGRRYFWEPFTWHQMERLAGCCEKLHHQQNKGQCQVLVLS